jgi:hydroxyethylthiazole kinase-like uncharacterized protein yjeF
MLMEAIPPEEARLLDENSAFLGVKPIQLMENAGRGVVQAMAKRRDLSGKRVTVLCYTGNKGGDGFVAARHLASIGVPVSVILLSRPNQISTEEARDNYAIIERMGSSIELVEAPTTNDLESRKTEIKGAYVIVDALLGTGGKGDLREPIKTAVEICNSSKAYRVSIDVPTGVDPATGGIGETAFKAHLTVTHHRPKTGLLAEEAKEYVGELEVISIGIPPEAEIYAGPGDLRLALKPRSAHSHKGENGRLLVVGGSSRYVGAPSLSALAALKVGVDLATVAVPYSITSAVRAYSPDLIVVPLPAEGVFNLACIPAILREAQAADAVVVGMGMGQEEETKAALIDLINKLNETGKPLVIDADALKALGGIRKELVLKNAVLTPHSGEFLALTGNKLPGEGDVGWEGRLETVKRWAKCLNATILLKSRYDIITDGQKFKIKTIGNAGMTAGGTGDVLAGIVGALMSKGESPFRSAVGASFLNSYAGDLLEAEIGQHYTAQDLVDMLPVALKTLGL